MTIPVKGNFLFRHSVFRYFVIFLSWAFFLFSLQLIMKAPWLLLLAIPILILEICLVLKRKKGLPLMIYEVWGILVACCWIVNLLLVMMDVLNFLSNIAGVSVLLFTCVFIAVGNNTAGNQYYLF